MGQEPFKLACRHNSTVNNAVVQVLHLFKCTVGLHAPFVKKYTIHEELSV